MPGLFYIGNDHRILTLCQRRLDHGCPAVGIDGRGGRLFAATQAVIQFLDALVHRVGLLSATEIYIQRHALDTQSIQKALGKVAAGIGNDLIIRHNVTRSKIDPATKGDYAVYHSRFCAGCHPARLRNPARRSPMGRKASSTVGRVGFSGGFDG